MLLTTFSPMRPPAPCQRTLLALVCALLLFAQYVGLAHALRHASNALPVQQQQVAYEVDQSGSRDFTATCALDAVLAQVLGAGPISAYSFSCETPPPNTPRHAASDVAHFDSPTARSRGPPTLI
jgi:hypothetical protein